MAAHRGHTLLSRIFLGLFAVIFCSLVALSFIRRAPSSPHAMSPKLQMQMSSPVLRFAKIPQPLARTSKLLSRRKSTGLTACRPNHLGGSRSISPSHGTQIRDLRVRSSEGVLEAVKGSANDMVKAELYSTFQRETWFGERDAYNLPKLETLTQGKTTRLVKEGSTGDILVGYKENVELPPGVKIDPDSIQLAKEDGKGVVITAILKKTMEEADIFPGDTLVMVNSLNCSESSLDQVKAELGKGGSISVSRELFKPAWMEPKVWGDEGERRRTYFNEQKYNKLRKAKDKNFRSSPGIRSKDIKVFERGTTQGLLGGLGSMFQRSKMMGEGSFGQVFDGRWKKDGKEIDIVLKRSKDNVIAASEMLQLELILNKEVAAKAPSVVSPFLGFVDVPEEEEGQIYDGFLSTGLWLLWEDVNGQTLDVYMSETYGENEYPGALKQVFEQGGGVVRNLGRRLFEALKIFHSQGLVHRDVKSENLLILPDGSVRLIDLGATAMCKAKPLSYEVGVGPQDPAYTPPSDPVLLPEGSVKPNKRNLEELWDTYNPDRFDVYSAGTVILQAACPEARDREKLIKFQTAMGETNHNFEEVRKKLGLKATVLDEDSGAGWDFLAKCFAKDRKERPTAEAALVHPFLAQ